jgi:DNA-binding NarL/FixJ family response regulator
MTALNVMDRVPSGTSGAEVAGNERYQEISSLVHELWLAESGFDPETLTPTQTDELISASMGTKVKERAEGTDRHPGTVERRRCDIEKRLGVKTMSHAVRAGIVSQIIPVEQEIYYPSPSLGGDAKHALVMISHGFSDEVISRIMKVSPTTVRNRLKDASEDLEACNRPHAVRRAFEIGLFKIPSIRSNGATSRKPKEVVKSLETLVPKR